MGSEMEQVLRGDHPNRSGVIRFNGEDGSLKVVRWTVVLVLIVSLGARMVPL